MTSAELRDAFLKFFEERGHTRVPSSRLVDNDPTLKYGFTTAGMMQFKPLWAGLEEPLPYTRATSVQKCLRLSDLNLVGTDATHDTFFEMLGNFSFGDYQKEQAIKWAWEFITDIMKLPQERLWVSVHETDEEAASIWRDVVGLSKERVVYLGDEDNFWGPVGGKGPCGPSSEIFWDIEDEDDPGPGPGDASSEKRYTEIWNLVFPQFDQQEDGSRPLLKYRGVDTGAGLERMLMAVQKEDTIFDTDLFQPLMEKTADLAKIDIHADTWGPLAITVDHVRAVTFAIAEGVRPGNEKQDYVVRKLIRRALGILSTQGPAEPLLYKLSGYVVEQMHHVYPELSERREQIALMIKGEEEGFLKTLDRGMRLFTDAASGGKISGEDAFKLHDTYGFPIELTKWLAVYRGIEVDLIGFEKAMEGQREKSRSGEDSGKDVWKGSITASKPKFVGYDQFKIDTLVISYSYDEKSKEVGIQIASSPFYAEAGGQIGDTGRIVGDGFEIEVKNTSYNQAGEQMVYGKMIKGKPTQDLKGKKVKAVVDIPRRREIERAHTATHLLHAGLRAVLGEHVKQEGSLVEPGRLRFDFYHPSPMTPEEIAEVEKTVYDWIIENHASVVKEMSKDEAEAKGALAFFGEKYGDKVRVVEIPGISAELCGGTHLEQTGQIGMFLIISETGVAAGIRRIEALVGKRALEQISRVRSVLTEASLLMGTESGKLPAKVEELKQRISADSKMRERITRHLVGILSERVLSQAHTIGEVDFVSARVEEALGREGLRFLADALKLHRERIVGILIIPEKKGRMAVLCFASKSIAKNFPAGDILKAVASKLKGGGGGSPTLAEGSITETSADDLTSVFLEVVKSQKGAK